MYIMSIMVTVIVNSNNLKYKIVQIISNFGICSRLNQKKFLILFFFFKTMQFRTVFVFVTCMLKINVCPTRIYKQYLKVFIVEIVVDFNC